MSGVGSAGVVVLLRGNGLSKPQEDIMPLCFFLYAMLST